MSALLGEYGLYNLNHRQISGNTVADGSGNELRVVVDASGFIKVTQVPLSYLTDSVKVRGLYSNANVEQFGYSQQPAFVNTNQQVVTLRNTAGVDVNFQNWNGDGINALVSGMVGLNLISAFNGGAIDRLRNETGHSSGKGLQVFPSIGGVAQYGYTQQPSFVNTNQQVVTLKSSGGTEPNIQNWNSDGYNALISGLVGLNLIAAFNGGSIDRLRNETGHSSGKGLQVFPSIGGLAQYSFDGRVTLEPNGSVPVTLQDQHTDTFSFYVINEEGTFTLNGTATINTRSFNADPGHGIAIGDMIELYEDAKFFQALVTAVVGDAITVDSPLDFAFTDSANGRRGKHNMNVDGSGAPVVFRITPEALENGHSWDVVRINMTITDGTSMDDSTFGGIGALTNGVVCRKKDGNYHNQFNIKSNEDWATEAFDAVYADRKPSGFFGYRARRTWGGQTKAGVVIRLSATDNEQFEILIQDDLQGLVSFYIKVQGSVVIP